MLRKQTASSDMEHLTFHYFVKKHFVNCTYKSAVMETMENVNQLVLIGWVVSNLLNIHESWKREPDVKYGW